MDDVSKEKELMEGTKIEESIQGVNVIQNMSILNDEVDAIVLSANPSMDHPVGSGLDSLVYEEAGVEELTEARRKALAGKHELEVGDIFVTDAGKMVTEKNIKYIIHVIVPKYKKKYKTDRKDGNIVFLESIIKSIFWRAKEEGFKSLSFPLIGTGALGFKPSDVEKTIKRSLISVRRSNKSYFNDFTINIYCMDTKPNRNVKNDYPQIDDLLKMLDDGSIEVPDFQKMNKKSIETWVKNERLAASIDELKEQGRLNGKLSLEKIQKYMLEEIGRKIDNEEKEYKTENKLYKQITKYMARLKFKDEKNNIKKMNEKRLLEKAKLDSTLISKIKKSPAINIQRESVIKLALALELSVYDAKEFIRVGSSTLEFPASKREGYILQCIKDKIYDVEEIFAYCDEHFPEKSKTSPARNNKSKTAEEIEK